MLLFSDRVEEYAGILAHHYARAAEWAKPQHYLFLAEDQASRTAGDAEALAHYRDAVEAYARASGDRWDPVDRAVLERKVGEALFRRGEQPAEVVESRWRSQRPKRSSRPAVWLR